MKFGKMSEFIALEYIKGCKNIIQAVAIPHTDLTNHKIVKLEHMFGDIIYFTDSGEKGTVEVKTDNHCKNTGNISFELHNHLSNLNIYKGKGIGASEIRFPDKPDSVGWWHPDRKSYYNKLIYVTIGMKSVLITDALKCKRWCFDNLNLFTIRPTRNAVQEREKKQSVIIYMNRNKFINECPHAKLINIDTTRLEDMLDW